MSEYGYYQVEDSIANSCTPDVNNVINRSSELNNQIKTKKETTMSFNRPVSTKIVYRVSNQDVETLTSDQLFTSIVTLEGSIKALKKTKVKSKAVIREIKQQQKILKRIKNTDKLLADTITRYLV